MDMKNIKNAKWFVDLSGEKVSINAMIGDTQISVPIDPNNTEYAEIMRQVEAGTLTIQDAD